MTFITKGASREILVEVIDNIISLMITWEDRAGNYPSQKIYWDNRIKELDEALKPLLIITDRNKKEQNCC